jgi:predicted N-acetyltransferase YhbS
MAEELKVQYGKGNDSQQDEFIDFINYVFNFNGNDIDFYRMLPKLYKKENHPCENNYLALENDRIKAAVGSFPGEVTVSGFHLNFYGIGNVAVHPYSRSKGYMKKLMNQAVEDMLAKDVDFSVLGGRRQRYNYFSYEVVGRKYCFSVDETNIRHAFGKVKKDKFQFVLVKENDKETLHYIAELQKLQPVSCRRDEDKIYDIMKTWNTDGIYAIYEGTTDNQPKEQSFAGYLICYDKNSVREIILKQQEDIAEVIVDFMNTVVKGGINLEFPEYQQSFIDAVSVFAENVSIQDKENFSVFHYDRVIEAFLNLKAQTEKLADGEIVLQIHGKKRDENLLISVKDNLVTVANTDQKADYEYNHQEAMSVLFANYSPLRHNLPTQIQNWLPLPITIFPADGV